MDSAGYSHLTNDVQGPRRRFGEGVSHEPDEGVYDELQRLRGIVEGIEGDRQKTGLKLSLNNAAMSTVFGFVFVIIVIVTVYAFANLYRAIMKRFFPIE